MVNAISIALSGLNAAVNRLNASAANIANLQTAGSLEDPERAPYTPVTVQQSALTDGQGNPAGVLSSVVPRANPFVPSYDPDSPFANAEGLIGLPNVDLAEEAVNGLLARTEYKANIATLRAAADLSDELFKIVDKRA